MDNVIILGSTGSIGKSSIEVIKKNKKEFDVSCLVASSNESLIKNQAKDFKNSKIFLENPKKNNFSKKLICKEVLIANKEPLVMAGEFLMKEAKKSGAEIIPIDSEHCAVHQSTRGKDQGSISKITLTCSGGPFYNLPKNKFKEITIQRALKHPIWQMGKKITIDSSTLMNKALEIIEAKYLFNIDSEKIDTIIHPEGLVHSFVEFSDGTILASMANPDMKIPISYGLGFPKSISSVSKKIDLQTLKKLTFHKINRRKFPSIDFAYFALNHGNGMPIILNAANEVAVKCFLDKKLSFQNIFKLIASTLNYADRSNIKLNSVSLKSITDFNDEAKNIAHHHLKKLT